MKRLCLLLGLPLTSLFFVACGDDEKDPYASRDGFCAQWAEQACNTSIIQECADDEADCEAGQVAYCKEMVSAEKYNKAGGKKCAEAIGKALVDAELTPEELAMYQDLAGECSEVSSGNGGRGDSCTDDDGCATKDGLRCLFPAGETTGKCNVPREVEGGDDCDGAVDVCPSTHFCDAANQICRSLNELDEDCSLAEPCDADTRCVNPDTDLRVEGEEEGVCVARGGNQDDCLIDEDCLSNICSPNNRCVTQIDISGDSTFDSCAEFHN